MMGRLNGRMMKALILEVDGNSTCTVKLAPILPPSLGFRGEVHCQHSIQVFVAVTLSKVPEEGLEGVGNNGARMGRIGEGQGGRIVVTESHNEWS